MNSIFVYCEVENGVVADVSLELCTKGRKLANELKCKLEAVVIGNDLKDVENTIASSRTFYNDTVLMYNNKVQMFPSNLFANMFGFKTEAFFEIVEAEKENVQVKF